MKFGLDRLLEDAVKQLKGLVLTRSPVHGLEPLALPNLGVDPDNYSNSLAIFNSLAFELNIVNRKEEETLSVLSKEEKDLAAADSTDESRRQIKSSAFGIASGENGPVHQFP